MQYQDILAKYVNKSNLTLREIADRCKECGQSIDPSYISKLQTGRLPPPSEDVSRVLAKVLGGDAEYLIYLGYLEKAPKVVREQLQQKRNAWIPSEQDILFFRRVGKLSATSRNKLMKELDWLEDLERNRSQKKGEE